MLEAFQRRGHALAHFDIAGTQRTQDFKPDHLPAVEQRSRAPFGDGVADVGHLVEPHTPAIANGDFHLRQLFGGLHRGDGAHGLFAAAKIGAPARRLLLYLAQLRGNLGGRDIQSQQFGRAEFHPNLPRHAADAIDRPDALDAQQQLGDVVVDEPGQFLFAHRRIGDGIGNDRLAAQFDLGDDRIQHLFRQVAAYPRNGRPHIFQRLARIALQTELGRHNGVSVRDMGIQMFQSLRAGQRILDLARHLGFHLVRRRARHRGRHGDHRQIDIRKQLDLHGLEGHHAQEGEHDETENCGNGVAYGPGRNVHA